MSGRWITPRIGLTDVRGKRAAVALWVGVWVTVDKIVGRRVRAKSRAAQRDRRPVFKTADDHGAGQLPAVPGEVEFARQVPFVFLESPDILLQLAKHVVTAPVDLALA